MATLPSSPTDGALRCMVCNEELARPVTLPCLHSCCRSCAATIAVAPAPASGAAALSSVNMHLAVTMVRCPKCVEAWPKDERLTLHELPAFDNPFLLSCLALRVDLSKPASCYSCWESGQSYVAAAVRCLECRRYLCNPCLDIHLHFVASHTAVPVEEYRSGQLSLQNEPPPVICQGHGGADLVFYCQACCSPKCSKCVQIYCQKHGHKYELLSERASQLRQQLRESVEAVEAQFNSLEKVRERCTESARLLAEQKGDALCALGDRKKLLLQTVEACYLEAENRLRADVNKLTDEVLLEQGQCKALLDAAARATDYARLLVVQGHDLHLVDETASADESLSFLRRPEALAAITRPGLPSMIHQVATPDPETIKLWLGMPSWTRESAGIPAALTAAQNIDSPTD